jgi:chromosomal replication initiation ATPase DnaA
VEIRIIMKIELFNQYTDSILELFGIPKEDLFCKKKAKPIVEARHMLYYLCFRNEVAICYIRKYMEQNGYRIAHHSVRYGIRSVENRMKEDNEYASLVESINSKVYL